jgi:hypothetical protein
MISSIIGRIVTHHQPLCSHRLDDPRLILRAARLVGALTGKRVATSEPVCLHHSVAGTVHHSADHTRHKDLDPINTLSRYAYTLALLVCRDGLSAVPHDTVAAAEAMGYRGWQRLLLVELPVAVPVIAAGLRVAVVSNVSIVTMAALLGIPQLGSLFTQGFQLRLYVPLITGVVLCVVLAVIFDGLIIWLNKLSETGGRPRTLGSGTPRSRYSSASSIWK